MSQNTQNLGSVVPLAMFEYLLGQKQNHHHHALRLSPLGLWNFRNLFNRIRIILGKSGFTQIRTSSSCRSEKEKEFFNLFSGIQHILPRGLTGLIVLRKTKALLGKNRPKLAQIRYALNAEFAHTRLQTCQRANFFTIL